MGSGNFSFAQTRGAVGAAEWQTRVDLAAAFRLAHYYRMTDQIYTHLTAKVPGTEHFLINPYGVLFDEVTASCLVKVDLDGEVIFDPTGIGINPAGFLIHSCIHRARPDVHSVMHTHTAAGIAVAAQKRGLLKLSQHSMRFHNRIGYHDYEGVALDFSEQERLVRDLGPHCALILRNHGLLAAGRTASGAFQEIYFLERACQAQISALAGGGRLRFPNEEVCRRTAGQYSDEEATFYSSAFWQASLRLIENDRPDYRG